MVILKFKEMEDGSGFLQASIRCQKCGVVGTVDIENISSIRRYKCKYCGHLEENASDKNSRKYSGIRRLNSIFYQLLSSDKIDLDDFVSREDFVRWSVSNGYRDYKNISKADGEKLITRKAKWVYSRYGNEKMKETSEDAYRSTVRLVGSNTEECLYSINRCIERINSTDKRYGSALIARDDMLELRNKLEVVEEQLKYALDFMDKRFV